MKEKEHEHHKEHKHEEVKTEEPKKGFKKDNISMTIFIIVGIIIGYISFLLNNNYYSLILMIIVLFVSQKILGKMLKVKEGIKWWMKNGGIVYIFLWFISWIVFFNL